MSRTPLSVPPAPLNIEPDLPLQDVPNPGDAAFTRDPALFNPDEIEQYQAEQAPAETIEQREERRLVAAANHRTPITDQQAIEIADTISKALWYWWDNTDAALSPLENLSAEEVARVNDQFVLRHGDEWDMGSLRSLFIDQMSGATLDRALDLVEGFNPDRLARLVHEAGYAIFDYSAIKSKIDGLTTEQYAQLSESFKTKYGTSLADYIQGELFDYQVDDVLGKVFGKQGVELATWIHNSLGDADYSAVAFTIASLSPEAKAIADQAYSAKYGVTLDEEYAQLSDRHRKIIEAAADSSPLALEVIKLRQALGFFTRDADAITHILAGKNETEARELRRAYRAAFDEDFLSKCRDRLGQGDYSRIAEMTLRPGMQAA